MKVNSIVFQIIILALFSVAFFSCSTCFSQTQSKFFNSSNKSIVVDELISSSASTREASLETNFNFVSWFMGTKQSLKESSLKESSTKKLLINSGVAPNRILMKTFLKKAQNQTSSIA